MGGRAGEINQGSRAVAVGYAAGQNNQHDNSIVLNATSSFLDTAGTSRTYIKPLRAGAVAGNIMAYDSTSGEVIDYTGVSVDASSGLTVQGDISVSNLVAQNVETTNLTLDTLSVSATYTLQNVCDTGNTTSNTVQFTNPTTGLVTTSNLEVGGTLRLGTVDFVTSPSLGSVTGFGNTTPYTAEFNNVTTGLVTTSNVEVGGELTVSGNATVSSNLTVSGNATVSSNLTVGGDATVTGNATMTSNLTVSGDATVSSNLEVGTANLFVDTTTSNVGIGTNAPLAALDVRGVAQFGLISNSGGVASVYNSGSWTTGTEIELGTLDWEKYKFHQIRCRFVGTNSTFQRYNARIRVRVAGESSFKTSGYESFASLLRVTSSTTLHSAYNGGDGPLVAYFSDTDHPGADAFIIIDICNTLNGRGQIQINGSYTYGTVGYTRVIAGCHHVSAGTYDKIKLYFEQFDGNNTATSSYGDWVLIGYR